MKDVRYAARGLAKSPGTAVVAVIALTLGIGLTSVMFSIVYGALHRGLPFEGGDRIVHMERANLSEGIESMEVTIHDFAWWEERQRSFETFAAFRMGTVNIRGTERPERFEGAFVSDQFFEVTAEQPILGRTFTPDETGPGVPLRVVLGHSAWEDRFGRDPGVLNQTVTVNGEQGEIIGVMPEGFEFPLEEEVWVPLRLDPVALPRGEGFTLEVIGKLREGISIDQAGRELELIAAELAAEYPETNEGVTARLKPYTEEFIGSEETGLLYVMLVAVVLVLIIACANVANLLLARASTRIRDMAIRTAMGASRRRIIGQVMSEAVVLAAVGVVFGLGVAWVGITLFDRAVEPTNPPFWLVFKLDAPILAFIAAIGVLAALVSGVIPALRASRTDVNAILKDESRGSSSLQIGKLSRALVVAEVALSMALLFSSGLMFQSFTRVNNIDPGFRTDEVFSARVGVFPERFPDTEARLRFWEDLENRLAAIPGVRAAALSSTVPGTGNGMVSVRIVGRSYQADQDVPFARWALATPDFDDAMGFDVLEGRWFNALDGAGAAPVAIVNRSFADAHFPEEGALGRFITPQLTPIDSDDEPLQREIVGIVPDLYMQSVGDNEGQPADGFYLPLAQLDANFLTLLAWTDGEPLRLTQDVRDAVIAADPDTPIYWARTVQQAIDENLWFYGIFGSLFMAFGAAALFLSSVGLYGVMAFSVTARTQEMGVRMALGSAAREVRGLVLRQGLRQILIGSVIGTGLALLLGQGLSLVLFGVTPWDPVTLVAVFLLLLTTGMAASFFPALRATRVDPVVALRAE
jgi:putative ABC transport system permease protein